MKKLEIKIWNAALEKAAKMIQAHRVIEGEREEIRETVDEVKAQFIQVILALRK